MARKKKSRRKSSYIPLGKPGHVVRGSCSASGKKWVTGPNATWYCGTRKKWWKDWKPKYPKKTRQHARRR